MNKSSLLLSFKKEESFFLENEWQGAAAAFGKSLLF
jgi:hypothetical protein